MYLIGELGIGGQECQLVNLLETIDRKRYKPAVVVWNYNKRDVYVSRIEQLDVPVLALPVGANRLAKMAECAHVAKGLQPEVVHSYSFYTNFAAWRAALEVRAVAIGSIRSDFFHGRAEAGKIIGHLSSRWPRHHICNSRSAAQQARKSLKLPGAHGVHVVVNGVNLNHFRPRQGQQLDGVNILAVGSLTPVKRWDVLLRAARELKRRKFHFRLRIAGSGPLSEFLTEQIYRMAIEDCVALLGQVHEIREMLNEASFVVHTSDMEGCPNALLEAMSSGKAIVATGVGDVPYLVEDGITGFVVKRGDDSALIERIGELMSDRELCSRMGKAARAKAEREFTLERLVEQTLAVYRAAGWSDS